MMRTAAAPLAMSILLLSGAAACEGPPSEQAPAATEGGQQEISLLCALSPSHCTTKAAVENGFDPGKTVKAVLGEYGPAVSAILHHDARGLALAILGQVSKDDLQVTTEVRRELCKASGGLGLYSLEVKACDKGKARVIPNGLPEQLQDCDGGDGGNYAEPNFCVYEDPDGLYYWDDGPSIPAETLGYFPPKQFDKEKYTVFFWPAGQKHDSCYHHNPITYGHSKKVCDDQFLKDLRDLCAAKLTGLKWFDRPACELAAQLMHTAVDKGGQRSWEDTKTRVNYKRDPKAPRSNGPSPQGNGTGVDEAPECTNICDPGQTRKADCSCGCDAEDEGRCDRSGGSWSSSSCSCKPRDDF